MSLKNFRWKFNVSDYRCFKVKRGTHVSKKCSGGEFKYKCSLEQKYALQLDADVDVVLYSYEPVKISYIHADKQHTYSPDFIVEHVDGSRKLVEVKYSTYLKVDVIVTKAHAAALWCEENGCTFEFVTEKHLKV